MESFGEGSESIRRVQIDPIFLENAHCSVRLVPEACHSAKCALLRFKSTLVLGSVLHVTQQPVAHRGLCTFNVVFISCHLHLHSLSCFEL